MSLKANVIIFALFTMSALCGATELTASKDINPAKVFKALPSEVISHTAVVSTERTTPGLFRMDVTEIEVTSKIIPRDSSPASIKAGERFKLSDLFVIEKSERAQANYTITCRNENSISADVLRQIISKKEFPSQVGSYWIALAEITTKTEETVEEFLTRVVEMKLPSIILFKEAPLVKKQTYSLSTADDCAISVIRDL